MWAALIRVGARYAFFRRWKNTIFFVGAMTLCGIAALLIDTRMYLSAGFVGVFAVGSAIVIAGHYLRQRREEQERERRKRQ
jgi:hypothetical protein